ncbi:MAG: hypothetical protein JWL71_3963 [Acidobacteria bacterium]|nr:hypothetical protein [Acidobacteriota bacterium]
MNGRIKLPQPYKINTLLLAFRYVALSLVLTHAPGARRRPL